MLAHKRLPEIVFAIVIGAAATGCSSETPETTTGTTSDGTTSGEVGCPTPAHGPTTHKGFDGAETWTADESPHVVPFDLSIHAKLSIEPCAKVLIASGANLEIFSDGRIEANGLAGREISFGRQDPHQAWGTISLGGGGSLSLENATLDGGGVVTNAAIDRTATIAVIGDSSAKPDEVLHLAHVVVSGSSSLGLDLETQDPFSADSDDLTVTGSASYPLRVASNLLGSIPVGKYTGNAVDEILVPAQALADTITTDMTIHERGVPYHIGDENTAGELRAEAKSGVAILTVEAGVALRFKKGGALVLDHFGADHPAQGALVALGKTKPIVFTSAEKSPKAGDWFGVSFGGVPSKSELDNVRIEFAGATDTSGSSSCPYPGEPINDAAIRIYAVPGNGVFVKNSTISDSGSNGVDRGWKGPSTLDFIGPNHFSGIARCKQTLPAPPMMGCPADPPCP